MNQMMMRISALCMTAAICDPLMQKNRFGKTVRILLGLEIARVIFKLADETLKSIL